MTTDKTDKVEKEPGDVGASAAKAMSNTAKLAEQFEYTLAAQKQQANVQRAGVTETSATTFAKKGTGAVASQATKPTKSSPG